MTGFPETYFIDADGKVRYRIAGPVEERRGPRRGDRARRSRRRDRTLVALVVCSRSRSPRRRAASEPKPTPAELESELVCPVCETTLDTSDAPVARRMKAFIRERIAAGDTKSEIKAKLVDQFGTDRARRAAAARASTWWPGCCRSPGSRVGVVAVGALAWRWSRGAASADAGRRGDRSTRRSSAGSTTSSRASR